MLMWSQTLGLSHVIPVGNDAPIRPGAYGVCHRGPDRMHDIHPVTAVNLSGPHGLDVGAYTDEAYGHLPYR
jgi:hypothetical protein